MKKKLLLLSPLLVTALVPSKSLAMKQEIVYEETTLTLAKPLPKQSNPMPSTEDLLIELRNSPVFKKLQAELNPTPEEETQIIIAINEINTAIEELNNNPEITEKEKQEKENEIIELATSQLLQISQLIEGTIPTSDDELQSEEDINQAPTRTGLGWALYVKSLIYTPADLAIYALENKLFESDNIDHQELLEKGILDARNNSKDEHLTKIMLLIKEKYSTKVTTTGTTQYISNTKLADSTSLALREYKEQQHKEKEQHIINNFVALDKEKQVAAKAIIEKLQQNYAAATTQITEIMNNLNSAHKTLKDEFTQNRYAEQKFFSNLKKISNDSASVSTVAKPSWGDVIQNKNNGLNNVGLTAKLLNDNNQLIAQLSQYLAIEDQQ